MNSFLGRTTRIGLMALLVSSFALTSWASDSEPQRIVQHSDDAEIGVTAIPRLPMTAEQRALEAIREEGRLQVRAIVQEIRNTKDPEQIRSLRMRAVDIKKQTRLSFLRAKVEFARARSDLRTEQQALALINAIENPPKPVPSFHIRKGPDERGQR